MLKFQYFGHLMWRTDSLERTLMLGKIEGRRRRGWDGWMASPTQWTWVQANSMSWWWSEKPGMLQSMGSQIFRHNWTTELNIFIEVNGMNKVLNDCFHPFPHIWCSFFKMIQFIYLFGSAGSSLPHAGSSNFVVPCQILNWGMWDLVPQPGIKLESSALGAWSLGPWTTREVLFGSSLSLSWNLISIPLLSPNSLLLFSPFYHHDHHHHYHLQKTCSIRNKQQESQEFYWSYFI